MDKTGATSIIPVCQPMFTWIELTHINMLHQAFACDPNDAN